MSKLENGPKIADFELHFFQTTMFVGGLTKKYIMYVKKACIDLKNRGFFVPIKHNFDTVHL